MVGDAVGVVAVGACGTALALLFGRAEPPPLLHRCDHGQVPVHKEIRLRLLVELTARHGGVIQHAVLLAVKGCPALPAVLAHDERINPVCVQPAPDLGIHIVPGSERLTVTAVAVRPGVLDIVNRLRNEPLAELLILPVEGGVAPRLPGEPVGMLRDQRCLLHSAPRNEVEQDIHALGMGVLHEIPDDSPALRHILRSGQGRLHGVKPDIAVAVSAGTALVDGIEPDDVYAGFGIEVDQGAGILELTADGRGVQPHLHDDGCIQPGGRHQRTLLVGGRGGAPSLVGKQTAVVDFIGRVGVGVAAVHGHRETAVRGAAELRSDIADRLSQRGGGAALQRDGAGRRVHLDRPVVAVALHCQRDDLAGATLRLGGMRAVLFIHDGVQPVQLGAAGVGHARARQDGVRGLSVRDNGQCFGGSHGHFLRNCRGGLGGFGRIFGGRFGGNGGGCRFRNGSGSVRFAVGCQSAVIPASRHTQRQQSGKQRCRKRPSVPFHTLPPLTVRAGSRCSRGRTPSG